MRVLLVCLLVLAMSLCAENKIIYILSTPRSLSTTMFRVFENHEDFEGFNEPTVVMYAKRHMPEATKDWFTQDAFSSYSEMKTKIFAASIDHHVIVKDTNVCAYDFFMEDEELIKDSRVHFVILFRDPYRIISSLYKLDEVKDFSLYEELGTKTLYEMYQRIQTISPNSVHLVSSEDLLENPENEINNLLSSMEIPFSERTLSWKGHDSSFTGKIWHEQKRVDLFHKFHGSAIKNTHILKTPRKKIPSENQMFLMVESKEVRENLLKAYYFHLPSYQMLLAEINPNLDTQGLREEVLEAGEALLGEVIVDGKG